MQLTVKPLKNREPGSGMAVIDRQVLEDSELSSGDFVRLQERSRAQSAIANVWPSDCDGTGRGCGVAGCPQCQRLARLRRRERIASGLSP